MSNKIILIITLLFSAIFLFASEEDEHNKQMLQVLFGRPYTINEDEQRNIRPLEMAIYLTIDLYNGDTYVNKRGERYQAQRYLDDLKKFGVKKLPKLPIIDFTAGSEHQRYTHRGWDWIDYPSNYREYNFQNIWNVRKQLVYLATLDKIFSFNRWEYEKRDSFAALLYYVHILGDHIGDKKRSYMDRIPISPRPDYRFNQSGENSNNPTIYTELLYHLPRLFKEQTNSIDYGMLMRYLERNKNRQFSTGTTISDEEYAELQTFAKETLDKLIEYIPRLLRNEDFFKRVFFK
jgi:hypothetical protein